MAARSEAETMTLSQTEAAVLSLHPSGQTPEAMAQMLSLHPDAARKAAASLAEKGLLSSSSTATKMLELTPEGEAACREGLPEVALLLRLKDSPVEMDSLPGALLRFGMPAAKRAGWISISGQSISLAEGGRKAMDSGSLPRIPSEEEGFGSLTDEEKAQYARRGLLRVREKTTTVYSISQDGENAVAGGLQIISDEGIGALSREILREGSWKGKKLREYDVSAASSDSWASRRHPISALRKRIGGIFTRMGFEEMSGPHVESAFWNFDALFQPQDHPARDLADTFYVSGASSLPNRALVERVRHAHGAGWKCKWEEAPAKKKVLRTHTTAVSARTLSARALKGDKSPSKFFCIGKVFRNEATDYKHLAEFFQVEGIIAWEGATFRDLLGTLKEFYLQLGFEKIRFRPSFFPYTEPSLEIEVFHPARNAWMELGGAGIFRPEVCAPLGCHYPVLAWGLSLERPLMLSNKIDDIRSIYRNEVGWLRNFPIG